MNTKKDITSPEDIKSLVDTFYENIKKDTTIGYFFTDVVHVDWDKHLPNMYLFWESIVFKNAAYKGNPMLKHIALNKKEALNGAHFNKWITLWETNVNTHFTGKNATEIVVRAKQIAGLMEFKVSQ
jgi:hemoglobin